MSVPKGKAVERKKKAISQPFKRGLTHRIAYVKLGASGQPSLIITDGRQSPIIEVGKKKGGIHFIHADSHHHFFRGELSSGRVLVRCSASTKIGGYLQLKKSRQKGFVQFREGVTKIQ